MIINFNIQNFWSVKNKQTLSFEADKSTHLEDSYVMNVHGHRLLKIALIYGANASGKTNILKALDFLRNLVLNPESKKTEKLDFEPFLFDPKTPKEPSTLSISFIQNQVKYDYVVTFSQQAIIQEKLLFYNPNKAIVFERTTDIAQEYTSIKFGRKMKVDKTTEKSLIANTLWNNTVLGGYLKTNINIKELKEVTDWFKNYLQKLIYPRTSLKSFVTQKIDTRELSEKDVAHILKKADFHISNILIKEEKKEVTPDSLDLLKQFNLPDDVIKDLEKKGEVTHIDVEFEHAVNGAKYTLPFKSESEGTKRYYEFAGLLLLLIKGSVAFPIDELESSLHPDLYRHFLISFLRNAQYSQIIATTHHREILDDKDLFRNDAIWLTDKNKDGATELYSLADFDTSVIRDTTNILNAYKTGKLGGTPHLGDTFIQEVEQ